MLDTYLYRTEKNRPISPSPVKTMSNHRQQKINLIGSKGKPEQYGLHQARVHHWKPKNHKDDYTDLASGSHLYTPISAPYIQSILKQLKAHTKLLYINSTHEINYKHRIKSETHIYITPYQS